MLDGSSSFTEKLNEIQKFKVVLLGEANAGKSSIITRYLYDDFGHAYRATVGLDFMTKTVIVDSQTIRLRIWDTAGQERFRSLTPAYIRNSEAAIIVFDVTSFDSFAATRYWVDLVRTERPGKDVVIALVANKVDLTRECLIKRWDMERMAKQTGCLLFETSAKTGYQVTKVFADVVTRLLEQIESREKILGRGVPQKIGVQSGKKKDGCC